LGLLNKNEIYNQLSVVPFYGVLTALKLNNKRVDVIENAIETNNIEFFNNCEKNSCTNDSVCLTAQNERGHKCHCPYLEKCFKGSKKSKKKFFFNI
jgi:hypothetical protein